MNKKTRIIVLSILFIPFVWLYTGWLRNKIYQFDFDRGLEEPLPFDLPPVTLGVFITLLGMMIALLMSIGKTKKDNYKIWGISIIILSIPLTDALGFWYMLLSENHFAYLIVLFVSPFFLLIGICILLLGFVRESSK